MHAYGQRPGGVRYSINWAKNIHRDAPDGRQKNAQIRTRHEFRKHATCLFKKRATQGVLVNTKPSGDPWQIPHWLERRLGHHHIAAGTQNRAIDVQTTNRYGFTQFRNMDMRPGDSNRRPNVEASVIEISKRLAYHGPEWIHRDDG